MNEKVQVFQLKSNSTINDLVIIQSIFWKKEKLYMYDIRSSILNIKPFNGWGIKNVSIKLFIQITILQKFILQ